MANATAQLLASVLSHRGAVFLDERGLIDRAFQLELAARRLPSKEAGNVQEMVRDLLFGSHLPDVQYVIGPGLWEKYAREIKEFSDQLALLARNYQKGRTRLVPTIKGIPLGLMLVPMYSQSGNSLKVTYRVLADELHAVFTYVLSLLLDEGQGFGRKLCRCNLSECGKYFLAYQNPAGGPPRRRYCSEAHMTVAHNQDAGNRVARKREADRRKGIKRKS